jgi:hypothetical protein
MSVMKIDRRQFIRIAAGSTLAMLSSGTSALFAREAVPKSRRHGKIFSKGKSGDMVIMTASKKIKFSNSDFTAYRKYRE